MTSTVHETDSSIAERQTSPHAEGDVEIWLMGGSPASDAKRNLEWRPY